MRVIINPQKPVRKTYTNLPEREPHKERIRPSAKAEEPKPAPVEELPEEVLAESDDELEATGGFSRLRSWFTKEEIASSEEPDTAEEERSWKNSRWSPVLFLLALGLFAGIGYFAIGFQEDLQLERIVVEGAEMLSDKEIISLAGIDRTQRFYDIDLKQVAERIEKHSLVKVALPRRETNPQTIVLRVEERHPIAMMRSEATGEALLIDQEGRIIRPKLLSGLKDPTRLLQVPLLSGISEKDTTAYLAMSHLVMEMHTLEEGTLADAIGELKKTPTGSYVIYTSETQTPIFIGSPNDEPFIPSLEVERNPDSVKAALQEQSLFRKQLTLLAKVWKEKLKEKLRQSPALYVDARFAGKIVVKRKGNEQHTTSAQTASMQSVAKAGDTSVSLRPIAQGH